MTSNYPEPPAAQKHPMPGSKLGDTLSSYTSGTTIAVSGEKPFI